MLFPSSAVQSLRRVFQTAFTVCDIAEPLASFDATTSAEEVREDMESSRFRVAGVRSSGRVQAFIEISDLGPGACGDYQQEFDESLIIPDSMPLVDLVQRLRDQQQLFVSVLGQVGGIVSRSDLQKPPVRMWLFGMLTLIEMRTTRLITRGCPDDTWQAFLSDARVQKSQDLMSERARRHQEVSLLDCLQLSDKLQIVARNEDLRRHTRFRSRRQMDDSIKMLERLRNNLAHSQDIIADDWGTIVALSENFENVLNGPQDLPDESQDMERTQNIKGANRTQDMQEEPE